MDEQHRLPAMSEALDVQRTTAGRNSENVGLYVKLRRGREK
jgi:hypothetical protein